MTSNPTDGIRLMQFDEVTKAILSLKEIQKLAITPCPNNEVKRAFLFSCYCGLRWCDVDLDAGTLSIERNVQYIPGKGTVFTTPKTKRSRRCIKIGPECVQLLREYRQHQKAERFKVGSEWVRRVEIENCLLYTSPSPRDS